MNLRAHLCCEFCLRGGFPNDAGFRDVVCERLFAINVFAEFQRGECGEGVSVFACANDDRVEGIRGFVEELPEVCEFRGFRVFLSGSFDRVRVHVADRDDIFGRHAVHVRGSATAGTDDGDVQLFVRSTSTQKAGCANRGTRDCGSF